MAKTRESLTWQNEGTRMWYDQREVIKCSVWMWQKVRHAFARLPLEASRFVSAWLVALLCVCDKAEVETCGILGKVPTRESVRSAVLFFSGVEAKWSELQRLNLSSWSITSSLLICGSALQLNLQCSCSVPLKRSAWNKTMEVHLVIGSVGWVCCCPKPSCSLLLCTNATPSHTF